MTKEELVRRIIELNEGDGFDIIDQTELGDPLYYGVRQMRIIDTGLIIFGSYGGHTKTFNMEEYSSLNKRDIAEDVTKYIFNTLESTGNAKFIEMESF